MWGAISKISKACGRRVRPVEIARRGFFSIPSLGRLKTQDEAVSAFRDLKAGEPMASISRIYRDLNTTGCSGNEIAGWAGRIISA
jgi:hypothetical protein